MVDKKKRKVLHFVSDTNIGGAGKYVITYCKNYNQEQFSICVVVPCNSKLIPELKKCHVEVMEVDGLKDCSLDIKAIGKLKRIIQEQKPDIVHTHASLSARIAAKWARSLQNCFYKAL